MTDHNDPHPSAEAGERLPFDDPRVQTAYEILCDGAVPPKGEHWEGFVATRIVEALAASPQPAGLAVEASERFAPMPATFDRRWKLARDGFGLQRDDEAGNYVHIDDALDVLQHYTARLFEAQNAAIALATHQQAPLAVVEDAERYRFWRARWRAQFALSGPGKLTMLGGTPSAIELSFERAVDAAIDSARRSTRADGDAASAGQGEVGRG